MALRWRTLTIDLSCDEIYYAAFAGSKPNCVRGITSLAIFGSRSRGDARQDSDLDVLIETATHHPFL